MKLYYMTGACPLVTRIALEWIGKPFESQRVSRDELQQEEFLKLNPNGAVPVLVDGDLVLTRTRRTPRPICWAAPSNNALKRAAGWPS